MDNAWKDKLRERFSDYSVPEPEGLWEGIEQGMAGKPRRKMLPVWLVSGAAVAAAVALVVFLHEEVASVPADPVAAHTASATETAVPEEVPVPQADPAPKAVPSSVPFAVASRQTLLSEAMPAPSVPVDEDRVPDAVRESAAQTIPQTAPEIVPETAPATREPEIVSEAVVIRDTLYVDGKEKRKRFSVSAYRHGGQAAADQSQGYGMQHTGGIQTRATSEDGAQPGLMRLLSANRASTYDARHSAPVRIGVQAAWPVTDHLSLVSGLTWTTLRSQFEESTVSTRMEVDQRLGYLGVPLRVQATFNPWNKLWLFADAGGMLEKGLQASSVNKSFIGNHLDSSTTTRPDLGGLLWSVGVSAGAEYRFAPHVGVYFAPGVEYHFDNGSAVRSAYTEKPLHGSFSMGVRFIFGK